MMTSSFTSGDIVYSGDRQQHEKWVKGLPGRKYLLLGNHDRHSVSWYEEAGFTVLGKKPLYWHRPDNGRLICFSHAPEAENVRGWTLNVHGHVHRNPYEGGTKRIEDRRNVCVEVTDYAPVRLRDVLASPNLHDPLDKPVYIRQR
jgi:calcineurin-like phosphoesterase family protein